MRELSLFTGAGGGIYASKILKWKAVGYVEWEDYCQKVIAQRIKDGIFDEAPIFGDIRSFVSEGFAKQYKGMVDIVTGGFPCQPFSVAGKRKAADDDRNMWPATLDVIKSISPPFVFLENVPGLLSATVDDESGRSIHYFGTILRDLAESGYDVRWLVLGADDVNAPHHRKRLWIFGVHADTKHNGSPTLSESGSKRPSILDKQERQDSTSELERMDTPRNVADSECVRQSGSWWSFDPSDTKENKKGKIDRAFYESRWGVKSSVGRVVDGVANRSNRLKSTGNGQVSLVAAVALKILSRGLV